MGRIYEYMIRKQIGKQKEPKDKLRLGGTVIMRRILPQDIDSA